MRSSAQLLGLTGQQLTDPSNGNSVVKDTRFLWLVNIFVKLKLTSN